MKEQPCVSSHVQIDEDVKGRLTGSNAALGAYLDVLPFQHVFVQGHDAGLGRIERRSRVAEALLLGNTPKRSSSTMPLMARPLPRHGSLSLSEAHFSGYCGNEPSTAVVIKVTIRALKYHCRCEMADLNRENLGTLEKGIVNLASAYQQCSKPFRDSA